jgi:membrane fusion protein (multidrug efflux system)
MSAKLERSDPHGHLNLVAPAPADETEPGHAVARAPAAKPEPPSGEAKAMAPVGRKAGGGLRRRIMLGTGLVIALAAAGWYGEHWWTIGRFTVSTDDAYVYAHNTTLAAKVPGYVAEIRVADNARVHAGDLIASIDDGDYRLAVDQARDKVASQEATIARIGRQVDASRAAVDQAKAQLASAEAGMVRADLELTRQQTLASRDFASRQALESAQANRDQGRAAVTGAHAGLAAAQANVEVTRAQEQEAQRALAELRTALAKAERDLRFTEIRAPIDGVIGNRAIQVGDYVQTGQRLASLVPLDEVYIDANFKETQLAHLRPGQKVAISVDALPDKALEGTVDSLAPASGAVFTLLPPDNATGNFTKIVQRVPVRVRVPTDVATQGLLRPGMSVVVSVNTKPSKVADGDAPTPPRMAMPRVNFAQGPR